MSDLRHSELYRLFFEETGDALVAAHLPESTLFAVNPAFVTLTGYSREELEGESLAVLNPPPEGEDGRVRHLSPEILAVPGYYNDVALGTRDGQVRFVTVKVRHAVLGGKPVAFAVLTDDTERQLLVRDLATKHLSLETAYSELETMHAQLKSTQDKIAQASKLMALGELAAGMSHELNQPLTGIRGFAQEIGDLLKTDPKPKKSDVRKLCTEIVRNADKMAHLLSHLRDFARRERTSAGREGRSQPRAAEPTSPAQSLSNVENLLRRQLERHRIRLEVRGFERLPEVLSQPHALEQVLINLITNSRDAVLEKRVNTGKDFEGHVRVSAQVAGEWVEVRVHDDGSGIPAAVREKVFDPFFTTKDPGKGLGLGLSISYGIAHEFGGDLCLETSSESGTTFLYRLRMAPAAAMKGAA
jgi:PAS domain S-box-containing protein